MNWDAIAAIGEAIGAIAVVVTLGYLAIQIKLGRVASEIQTTYASHESYSRWRIAIMASPELREAIAKANRQEVLTDEEEIAMSTLTQELFTGCVISAATNRREALFFDVSSEVEYLVSVLSSNRGFLPYWQLFKKLLHPVSPEFVDAVGKKLSALSE